MSTFTNSLKTEWSNAGQEWVVLESFEFHSGVPDSGLYVFVSAGTVTDLASIPKAIRWLVPKVGKDAQGAVCHDVAYRTGVMHVRVGGNVKAVPISRAMADSMYYQAMVVLKVGSWRRRMIYSGLVMGGWAAWNRYRKSGAFRTPTTA